uniref:hypothetical protein n=1 Tax=Edaphosphingomonas laterariae TaxID=861865 RepID=UPI001FE919E4|nr:hypothetical protein [Sphingomonas laterariae]
MLLAVHCSARAASGCVTDEKRGQRVDISDVYQLPPSAAVAAARSSIRRSFDPRSRRG